MVKCQNVMYVDQLITGWNNALIHIKIKAKSKDELQIALLGEYMDTSIRKTFRIHWRLSTILKTGKKVCELVFIDMWKYVCSESILNTLRWNTNVKKNSFQTKWTIQKMSYFSFCELQLITVLVLICDSYMTWSTRCVSCVGFSIFYSISFLLKYIFLFNKMFGLLWL